MRYHILLILLLGSILAAVDQPTVVPVTWEVGLAKSQTDPPTEFIPASVPGNVQTDWAAAKGLPDLQYDQNATQYTNLSKQWWTYRTTLPGFTTTGGSHLWFVSEGIDYQCQLVLAGTVVAEHTGMFSPCAVRLDGAQPGQVFEVRIQPVGALDRSEVFKPAVSWGWDFHPKGLVPLGMWRPARFEVRPAVHLADVQPSYVLSADLQQADVSIALKLSQAHTGTITARLLRGGTEAASSSWPIAGRTAELSWSVAQPELWWPRGLGAQARYTLEVAVLDGQGQVLDRQQRPIGFRRIALETTEVEGKQVFVTMRINDQAYYTKGSNLTPAQVFFGAITDDEQRTLVDLAAEANFNTLRVWGGGIVNGEAFFDRCDQRGIVVWQDFPLANRNYAQTDPYLAVLDQDARAIVRRLAPHPCLGMWCGGNELTSHMKPLESHPAIVRLAGICAELDPRTPFIPTDPWYGFKHSPYAFRDWRRAEGEIFAQFIAAQEVARTEFGISAPAPLAVLQRILPADKLTWSEALLADASWQYHKGFLAIDKNERYWFDTSTVEHYWGPMTDLTTMVGRAQWLQAEGLRFCHEELRRQRPGCAAALTWCFNEPWTCAANNSLLSWPAVPKPAYAAVQSALRDRLASARVAKFQWTPGERFTAQLFVCNDRFTALPPGTVTLRLRSGDWQQACEPWSHARVAGNTTLAGPTCTIDLPTTLGSDLVVELESGSGGYSNAYRLATKTVTTAPQ